MTFRIQTILIALILATVVHAADLETLLGEISGRTTAVFGRTLKSEQTVTLGQFADKTFRVYDYSVATSRLDGTSAVQIQSVHVYDEGGDRETATCAGRIRQNEEALEEEPDSLAIGEAKLQGLIDNATQIPYALLGVRQEGTAAIEDATALKDLLVGGEERVRLKLDLSDGKTIVRCLRMIDGEIVFNKCAE